MTLATRAVQEFFLRFTIFQELGSTRRAPPLREFDEARDYEAAMLAESLGAAGLENALQEKPVVLLEHRLQGLGLAADEIRERAPDVLAVLYRSCNQCPAAGRCSDDMKEGPVAPGWDSYCPNAGTLKLLA